MVVSGVVSPQTEKAVELFVRREDAGAFVREVAEDEPELAERLRLETIELEG